ncbi:MAG TPA: SulP family inorganic anion transporter [Alphaproteobacteria bacterium]|nr:SulP family inorganic anion transporter [Alphaproteobacteria bacterium]
MALVNGLRFDNVRGDLFGGVTAAVVALPLALAFGVASGAGAITGLYGAIFVGFFAALFGGTPSQVSGPTGPMTVVMAAVVTQYAHEPALAFTVVIMGGMLQLVFGVLRLGRYVTFVPFKVISGFMSGIGCIIIIIQMAPLFGHPGSTKGVLSALAALPIQVMATLADLLAGRLTPLSEALILGVVALAIVLLMPARLQRWAPAPLVALIAATLVGVFFLSHAPVIGEIPRGVPVPKLPTLSLAALPAMIQSALILALLGSIDSLLTSLIADNVTRTRHKSDRELIGQGIGNMVAGLFGGIPGAGATMRTVINVRAGGRTPLSGALHALVLLTLVLGLAPLAEGIPLAVLAGILLKVGLDIIDWNFLRRIGRMPPSSILVMLTVLVLTVVADLVTAVGVGIIMASLISASELSKHQLDQLELVASDAGGTSRISKTERDLISRAEGQVLLIRLSGPFSFCSANEITGRLGQLGIDCRAVVFDFTEVPMIDVSVAFAIEGAIRDTAERDAAVILAGIGGAATDMLDRLKVLDLVPPDRRHATRLAALEQALVLIGDNPTKDAAPPVSA